VLSLTKNQLKASKVQSQHLRKEGNGLVIIDLSLPLQSYIPSINNSSTTNYVNNGGQGKAFVPYAPNQKCVQSTQKNVQHGKNNVVKRSTNIVDNNKNGTAFESKKYAYSNNYKGKNTMTMTQWRRY
jgi:hypothetical protein